MPFGEPRKLRQIKVRMEELLMQTIAKASKGQGDLELQDAAVQSENVIGQFALSHDSNNDALTNLPH
jgi:hypothetical protein